MKCGFLAALALAWTAGAWTAASSFGEEAARAAEVVEPGPGAMPADVAPEIVATVNGKPLTRDQLSAVALSLYGRAALDALISEEVVRQEAAKQGITLSREEVEAYVKKSAREQLDEIARRGGAKDLADWGAKKGRSAEEIETMRKDRETALRPFAGPELLARKLMLKTIEVTDADLREEFERRYGPHAKVLQIVLRSKADAEETIKKLNLGADFAQLARDQSEDPVSRRAGGAIPPLSRGSALGDAAFRLKPGQISDVIETPDGFHVLKLVETSSRRARPVRGREGRAPGTLDRNAASSSSARSG